MPVPLLPFATAGVPTTTYYQPCQAFFFLRLGFNFYFTPLFLSLLYSIRVPFYCSVEQQVYELCQLLFFFLLFFFFQPLSICPTCPEPFDSVFIFVH